MAAKVQNRWWWQKKPKATPGYRAMVEGCLHTRGAICALCAPASRPLPARHSRRPRIVLRAPVNGFTGYGLHTCQIVRDLRQMQFELAVRPTCLEETFVPIPACARRSLVFEEQPEEWELLLAPPHAPVTAGKRTIYFTMWETTELAPHQVEFLNEAECVIVPSRWNAGCFRRSGVSRPIRVVPLGIDTSVFQPAPMAMEGPCVFGAAGRLQSGEERKGLGRVIALFQQAFPHETDVRLHVKAFPDCPLTRPADERIRVTKRYLTPRALSRWFGGITCFVSAARGEGWGLMQHQALATGRPLISVHFGGVAEYFQPEMGYAVDYRMVPATGDFEGCGKWAEPDAAAIIAAMREVYANRYDARARGLRGAEAVREFCWQRSNRELAGVIQAMGMVAGGR